MKTIRLAYANMWGDSRNFPASYMLQMFPYLAPHYHFILDPAHPQFVFYSVYGYVSEAHRYPDAIRLVYAGEPGDHFAQGAKLAPGVNEPGFYHYGLTCARDNTNENHLYYPQPALMLSLHNGVGLAGLVRAPGWAPKSKDTFANFIYSNGNSRRRVEFFHALQQYKRVESLGAVERNNDALAHDAYSTSGYRAKQYYQSRCKFSIAMESSYFPGYWSEKQSDPMLVGSVSIYSGDPCIEDVFNPEAFINVDKFTSDEEAIEFVKEIDNNQFLYEKYLHAPPFRSNVVPPNLTDDFFLAFWHRVLGDI